MSLDIVTNEKVDKANSHGKELARHGDPASLTLPLSSGILGVPCKTGWSLFSEDVKTTVCPAHDIVQPGFSWPVSLAVAFNCPEELSWPWNCGKSHGKFIVPDNH